MGGGQGRGPCEACPSPPLGLFFTLLLIYLLFTSFWSLSVLYFIWWIVDLDTPVQGAELPPESPPSSPAQGCPPGLLAARPLPGSPAARRGPLLCLPRGTAFELGPQIPFPTGCGCGGWEEGAGKNKNCSAF